MKMNVLAVFAIMVLMAALSACGGSAGPRLSTKAGEPVRCIIDENGNLECYRITPDNRIVRVDFSDVVVVEPAPPPPPPGPGYVPLPPPPRRGPQHAHPQFQRPQPHMQMPARQAPPPQQMHRSTPSSRPPGIGRR